MAGGLVEARRGGEVHGDAQQVTRGPDRLIAASGFPARHQPGDEVRADQLQRPQLASDAHRQQQSLADLADPVGLDAFGDQVRVSLLRWRAPVPEARGRLRGRHLLFGEHG